MGQTHLHIVFLKVCIADKCRTQSVFDQFTSVGLRCCAPWPRCDAKHQKPSNVHSAAKSNWADVSRFGLGLDERGGHRPYTVLRLASTWRQYTMVVLAYFPCLFYLLRVRLQCVEIFARLFLYHTVRVLLAWGTALHPGEGAFLHIIHSDICRPHTTLESTIFVVDNYNLAHTTTHIVRSHLVKTANTGCTTHTRMQWHALQLHKLQKQQV